MSTTTVLDAQRAAFRAGLSRGWIETRQSLTEAAQLIGHVLPPVAYLGVLLMLRGKTAGGTDLSVGALLLPGFLAMSIGFGGIWGPTGAITADREDGTLLRAKATPHGMLGYVVGKIVMFALTTLLGFIAVLLPGSLLVEDVILDARAWLLLALIFLVGMVATVPIGIVFGSLMKSSLQALLVPLTCMLLVFTSGIFYSISVLPLWLQWLVQAFPIYWLGLGVRSAMLPAERVAAELSGSWRTAETFVVLGLWAGAGLVLAPMVLRRMARRQSGSTLAATRSRIMTKGY